MKYLIKLRNRIKIKFCKHDYMPSPKVLVGACLSWGLEPEPYFKRTKTCSKCGHKTKFYFYLPRELTEDIKRDESGFPLDANGDKLKIYYE